MSDTPRRLDIVFQKYEPPLYFVTFNTYRRQKLLAKAQVQAAFARFAARGAERELAIGRYVIMPDHVHLLARGSHDYPLAQWIRMLKRELSKAICHEAPHWQRGFFDHLIRHGESYSQKWEYVQQNPVRAGLVANAEDWPWQGEIVRIEA